MSEAVPLAEVWRGDFLESVHRGHAVIADATGTVIQAWGDPDQVILPRSACKMIQALPLIESGAADAFRLTDRHIALACASHQGAPIHTGLVTSWLSALGLGDDDLRCGPQFPSDREAANALIRAGQMPCQVHNNCSGKHTGFLTVARHAGADPEYIDPDHPVQIRVREVFEDVTGEASPGYAIDGCSAPNFATTVLGLARGMARFAAPSTLGALEPAATRALRAMLAHPELVAGEGRACTELMRAMDGRVALKTGAEGVFTAILPERGLGVALKIEDGATRASECAITSILVELEAMNPHHPAARKRRNAPIPNRRGIEAAWIRPAQGAFSIG